MFVVFLCHTLGTAMLVERGMHIGVLVHNQDVSCEDTMTITLWKLLEFLDELELEVELERYSVWINY